MSSTSSTVCSIRSGVAIQMLAIQDSDVLVRIGAIAYEQLTDVGVCEVGQIWIVVAFVYEWVQQECGLVMIQPSFWWYYVCNHVVLDSYWNLLQLHGFCFLWYIAFSLVRRCHAIFRVSDLADNTVLGIGWQNACSFLWHLGSHPNWAESVSSWPYLLLALIHQLRSALRWLCF